MLLIFAAFVGCLGLFVVFSWLGGDVEATEGFWNLFFNSLWLGGVLCGAYYMAEKKLEAE